MTIKCPEFLDGRGTGFCSVAETLSYVGLETKLTNFTKLTKLTRLTKLTKLNID